MERNKTTEKEQSLYQQTVAIDGWRSSTGNVRPQGKKTNTGKDTGPSQSSNAKLKKNYTTDDNIWTKNEKITQNNNWAPSKIRLRLGAEVDKNYNKSNQKKNTIFLIRNNSTGTCALTTMISSTDKLGRTDKPAYVGPAGQLVLSAAEKEIQCLVPGYASPWHMHRNTAWNGYLF